MLKESLDISEILEESSRTPQELPKNSLNNLRFPWEVLQEYSRNTQGILKEYSRSTQGDVKEESLPHTFIERLFINIKKDWLHIGLNLRPRKKYHVTRSAINRFTKRSTNIWIYIWIYCINSGCFQTSPFLVCNCDASLPAHPHNCHHHHRTFRHPRMQEQPRSATPATRRLVTGPRKPTSETRRPRHQGHQLDQQARVRAKVRSK
jgi:hypothetical protein